VFGNLAGHPALRIGSKIANREDKITSEAILTTVFSLGRRSLTCVTFGFVDLRVLKREKARRCAPVVGLGVMPRRL
jgi:hypothetical protein